MQLDGQPLRSAHTQVRVCIQNDTALKASQRVSRVRHESPYTCEQRTQPAVRRARLCKHKRACTMNKQPKANTPKNHKKQLVAVEGWRQVTANGTNVHVYARAFRMYPYIGALSSSTPTLSHSYTYIWSKARQQTQLDLESSTHTQGEQPVCIRHRRGDIGVHARVQPLTHARTRRGGAALGLDKLLRGRHAAIRRLGRAAKSAK